MPDGRSKAPVAQQPRPERLIGDAVARIAVTAFRKGLHLSTHVDGRLPEQIDIDGPALGEALGQGLARSIEAGDARGFGLAFWHQEGPQSAGLILEIVRAPGARSGTRVALADLWSGGLARLASAIETVRRGDGSEALLAHLPCALQPVPARQGAPDRHVLILRDLLIDPARCRGSLAALGLDVEFAGSAGAAIEIARGAAERGSPFGEVVIDARLVPADGAADLAARLRGDPLFAAPRITFVTDGGVPDQGTFDAVIRLPLPWRRLCDGLEGLLPPRGPATARRTATGAAVPLPDLSGRRILIAEDAATNQALLRALLTPTGAGIATAANGREAIAEHVHRPADLILMDLQMPVLGGIAATRQIRAAETTGNRVAIVALTAHARPLDRDRAIAAGMDAYLVKPIVVAEFYELIARLLRPAAGSP